jgi:hypothetical protein
MPAQTDQPPQGDSAHQIEDLLRRLADGQKGGDTEALSSLLSEDFKLVGPLGFVVAKTAWLEQFRSGALRISALDWDEVEVRAHDHRQAAIAIGRLQQQAEYGDRPSHGTFRVTAIALHDGDRWLIAGLHYSAIASPPGS